MRVRRLGWAGVEIESGDSSVIIDLLEDVGALTRFIGSPREALIAPSAPGRSRLAAVTHLHSDHTDPAAIARALAPGGVLLRPAPAEGDPLQVAGTAVAELEIAKLGIATRVVDAWESVREGPFTLTAVPSVDGFGDPQVGWVVAADGQRVIHSGDTIFHGSWWLTRLRLGPFDAAFLPVNGAIVDLPHRQPPSSLQAAMGPAEAVEAAAILEAAELIPIHYDTLHQAPSYVQVDNPAQQTAQLASKRGLTLRTLAPGAWHDLAAQEGAAAA